MEKTQHTKSSTRYISTCPQPKLHALTDISGGCVFVGILVELPRGRGVHLDERDATTAPLPLRLVDGEEGLEEQIDNALGDRMGIDGQSSQQVVHVAHVPKLQSGTQKALFTPVMTHQTTINGGFLFGTDVLIIPSLLIDDVIHV